MTSGKRITKSFAELTVKDVCVLLDDTQMEKLHDVYVRAAEKGYKGTFNDYVDLMVRTLISRHFAAELNLM